MLKQIINFFSIYIFEMISYFFFFQALILNGVPMWCQMKLIECWIWGSNLKSVKFQVNIYLSFIPFNKSSRRKRGMAFNPLFIIRTRLFLHFPNEHSYGYLRFEGSQTETANREDLFPYLPKGIFPFPSNLRQPQLSFFWKMQRKTCLFPSKTCC